MEMAAGTLLGRNTRLLEPLGTGGMGAVWLAEHLTLGCEVAVKVLRADKVTAVQRSRFAREAKLAARIKSPYVVRIFDYGLSDGQPYIVMERLHGETLAEHLVKRGALSGGEVRALGVQLCAALQQAHALGVVHRDLKPHNVFLVRGHQQKEAGTALFAKLLDFGVAKLAQAPLTSVTKTGTLVGTPRYMSPEQLLNAKGVDAHADLWALAATLYEALTGVPAFDAKQLGRLWQQIDRAAFVAPSARRAAVGEVLDGWFARAFARDKSRRFSDAEGMAEALQAAFASGVAAGGEGARQASVSSTPAARGSNRSLMAASWDDDKHDARGVTVADEALARTTPRVDDTISRPLAGDLALRDGPLASEMLASEMLASEMLASEMLASEMPASDMLASDVVEPPPDTAEVSVDNETVAIAEVAATAGPTRSWGWLGAVAAVAMAAFAWRSSQSNATALRLRNLLPAITYAPPSAAPVVPTVAPPSVAEPPPPMPTPAPALTVGWRPPVPPPRTPATVTPSSPPPTRGPIDRCREPLVADEHGVLRPRLECLRPPP